MRLSSSSSVRPPYRLGSRRPSTSRLTPLRTVTRIRRGTLAGDQRVECRPHLLLRQLHVPARPVVVEQDEAALLVALQRRPGALAVDAHRLRGEDLLDRARVAPREAERGEEAERDGAAVRDAALVRGGRLERVREAVAE